MKKMGLERREVDTQDEAYMFLPEFINKIVTYVIPLVRETKFPENISHLIFFFDVLKPNQQYA